MRVLSSGSHPRPTIGEDGGAMKTIWKVLLGVAVVAPMLAYVVGSLAASATEQPPPRETIQIREPDPSSSGSASPSPSPRPSATSDDDVEVIVPDYEDSDGHDDRGDDDGGDHSGHGGGDDGGDHSGHGGGGDD